MDLFVAAAIMLGVSTLAFFAGRTIRENRRFLFLSTVVTLIVYGCFVQGELRMASVVPVSSSVLLSNLTPVLIALIAGYACRGMTMKNSSRPALVLSLTIVAVCCLMAPVFRATLAPAECGDSLSCEDGFVLQSHESTCAPASAANLLRLHGIFSDESMLVGPCLTSEFGTESLGLFRGLKLGCKDHCLDVNLASGDPSSWKSSGQLPSVAIVRFAPDEYSSSVTRDELQKFDRERAQSKISVAAASLLPFWLGNGRLATGHVVVVKDFVDDKWTVIDPAVGVVRWSPQEMSERFTGDAMYLSKRVD